MTEPGVRLGTDAAAHSVAANLVPQLDLDPFGDDFLADPFAFHSRLRAAGPLVYLTKYEIFGMARVES